MPFGIGFAADGPSAPPADPGQSALSLAWLDAGGATVSVRFDVVTAETHEGLMAITDHPVEVGSNIVDNARALPETVSIQGLVSNKPLRSNPGMSALLREQLVDLNIPQSNRAFLPTPGAITQAVVGAVDTLLNGPPPSKALVQTPVGDFSDRVRAMFETLEGARLDRALVRVVSSLREIDSMLIARVGVPRTPKDGTSAVFHVELRKIRLVSSETVDAPSPAEARGQPKAAKGSKGSQEATEGAAAKGQSILVAGGKSLGFLH